MGFGDSVTTLLETYSNCLQLLKAFNRRKGDQDCLSDEALLRKSIKSDRAKVRRAYSASLSASGSRFEKGDGPARSALRRVLKRLTAAIVNLLHSSQKQNPALDCESLMSLSNASRADAIRAIDQLSHRLGSTASRSSVASSSKHSRHRRHTSSSSNASSTAAPSERSNKTRSPKPRKPSREPGKTSPIAATKSTDRKGESSSRNSPSRHHSSSGSGSSRTVVHNRISMISTSTDSTNLGEIPERKWRRRHDYDTSSEEYNTAPIYPLKPYKTPPVKERRFWGLFGR